MKHFMHLIGLLFVIAIAVGITQASSEGDSYQAKIQEVNESETDVLVSSFESMPIEYKTPLDCSEELCKFLLPAQEENEGELPEGKPYLMVIDVEDGFTSMRFFEFGILPEGFEFDIFCLSNDCRFHIPQPPQATIPANGTPLHGTPSTHPTPHDPIPHVPTIPITPGPTQTIPLAPTPRS